MRPDRCPELVDTFTERIGTLLGSRNHAVLLTSLKLMREIIQTDGEMVLQLRRHVTTLIAALKHMPRVQRCAPLTPVSPSPVWGLVWASS